MSNQSALLPSHTYENPELGWLDCMLYFPILVIAPINVIISMISIPIVITFEKKHFHINFCIIHFNLIIANFGLALSDFLIIFIDVKEWRVVPIENYHIWHSSVIIESFSSDLMRCLWIAIFLERMFATIYSEVYETKHFILVSIGLSFCAYTIASIICIMRFSLGKFNYLSYCAISIIDILGAISIHRLRNYNRRIRQLDARSDIKLSQRYQLAENIRSLKLIFPILAAGSSYTLLGTVLIWLSMTDLFFAFFRYTINLYFLLFDIYILITSIIWLKHIILMDSYLRSIYWKLKVCSNVTPATAMPVILNVEGKNMNSNINIDSYFYNLRNHWS